MLSVTGLTKTYTTEEREARAVRDLSFGVRKGEFYTLLGASGCGKSTTLRCIAGLEQPEAGEIKISNQTVFSRDRGIFVPSHKRNLGMVFQSYAIWPHMSVFDNVAFPLVAGGGKLTKNAVREKVMGALALVKLDHLAPHPAPLLSGGQQQRVALARALAHEPEILLLDEPLSNLDAKLREEMRIQIRLLTQRLSVTTVYVTHDQLEALQMSDRIAVMRDGELIEEGDPRQIYLAPKTSYTASFVGRVNLFTGRIKRAAPPDGLIAVETAIGDLACHPPDWGELSPGDEVLVGVRPEGITIGGARPESPLNVLSGVIETSMFAGDTQDCLVQVGKETVQVQADPLLELAPRSRVYLYFPPARCVIVPQPTAEGT
jgi:iron(III) transport system ATP-binding protein